MLQNFEALNPMNNLYLILTSTQQQFFKKMPQLI
jgi:hypothetical protein